MKKAKAEVHAETRSSRRESNPPSSALSAPPRANMIGTETAASRGDAECAEVLAKIKGLLQ